MTVRRTALAVVLAVAALFISVAPAIAGSGDGGYIEWSATATDSPHGGYTTATRKCAVCHAVHNANPNGELLLNSSVADACIYCHVSTSSSYTQVYDSDPNNYRGDTPASDLPNAHNFWKDAGGLDAGVSCGTCHSAHGSTASMTNNAALSAKLLRGPKVYDEDNPNYDQLLQEPKSTDTTEVALTKWCGQCHSALYAPSGYYAPTHNSYTHIMTTDTATYGNPLSKQENNQVAYQGTAVCQSCHSSGYGTAAWPHFTKGARFLESAESSSAEVTATVDSKEDGVCLRCHRKDGTTGVGLTF